jgi:hypothetical protein
VHSTRSKRISANVNSASAISKETKLSVPSADANTEWDNVVLKFSNVVIPATDATGSKLILLVYMKTV